ncbi:DinB family protein [Anaerobacillus sp. CMMVII]|uniref:DinB family protein n=1 Tax=Anaerobacillus sp. CMMVII TaxID=2755588 RepID=UPI0021B7F164|nr:DinB family protein [Anaerobacillus sp. CMMVII]MCT8138316.1 DinB family protein [Anaerobacillus sp. CMMVII]
MSNTTLNNYKKTIEYLLTLKGVPQETLLIPIHADKWSVREIIGHLFYWDKFILEQMVPKICKEAKLPPFPDHDEYNTKAINYITKFQTTSDLIDEFASTRETLCNKIASVSPEFKFTIGKGKRQFTTDSFLKMFVKHDVHHLKQIQEFLKG